MLYILNEQTYDLTPTFSENLLEDGHNVVKTTFVNSKNEKFYLISKAEVAEVFLTKMKLNLIRKKLFSVYNSKPDQYQSIRTKKYNKQDRLR